MLKFCIAVTSIAVIAQICALIAMALRLRRAATAIQKAGEEIKARIKPTANLAKAIADETAPKFRAISADKDAVLSIFRRRQAEWQAAPEELLKRVEKQRHRIKGGLESAVERSQQVQLIFQSSIILPTRKLRRIGTGAKYVLWVLRSSFR